MDDGLYQTPASKMVRSTSGGLTVRMVSQSTTKMLEGVTKRKSLPMPACALWVSRDIFRLFYHYAEPGSP
jgi:hypothetical protein